MNDPEDDRDGRQADPRMNPREAPAHREEDRAGDGDTPIHDEGMDIPTGLPRGPDFLAHEFLLWLWYQSDRNLSRFTVGDKTIDLWVDDKISFQATSEERIVNTFRGGAPSTTPEARLSILSGKAIEEMRMGMRLDEQEWSFGLKAADGEIEIRGLRAPTLIREGLDEMLYERVFLIEELTTILHTLFRRFFEDRRAPGWSETIVPSIMNWLLGQDG